jgi:hypothetical protein
MPGRSAIAPWVALSCSAYRACRLGPLGGAGLFGFARFFPDASVLVVLKAFRWGKRDRASHASKGALVRLEQALLPCPVQLLLECPWMDGFLLPCGAIGCAMNTTFKEQLAQLLETHLVILSSRVGNLL